MATWRCVASLDELWEGEMLAVTIDAIDILLCNVAGTVYAYDDRCPHLANPLSRGQLDEHVLTCAAHEWSFDVRSGRGVNPATAVLRSFPVCLDGDTILVDGDAG
jgi:toluene monooxygenase system ferredoxin subunit